MTSHERDAPIKEVKQTKEERLKKEKAGLDVLADIYRYAETGFETIDPGDFMRFKWYGVYQQRPNEGHFMMRIKVPGGRLTTEQLRTLAALTKDYAHGHRRHHHAPDHPAPLADD